MFVGFESVVMVGVPIGVISYIMFFYILHSSSGVYRVTSLVSGEFSSLFFPFSLMGIYLFYIILSMNFMSLVPMGFSVSALGSVTLLWAVVFWLSNYLWCIGYNWVYNVAHFLPVGTPGFLMVILVWIEFISWLARPLALGVRLMANITASHLLLHLISSSVAFLMGYSSFILLGLVGLILMVVLEIAVAAIQAYVFSLLLSLYVSEGVGL